MIAVWMAYGVLVALLLGGAAAALERALRLQERPARWVWAGALAGSWLVPIATALGSAVSPPASAVAGGAATSVDPALLGRLLDQAGAIPVATPSFLEPAGDVVLALWVVMGTGGLLLFGLALRRVLGRVRGWPRARVLGESVRVSPDFGPAVVGLRRPHIVLPGWVLGLGRSGQRMVLRHEQEHRAARDTLLLAGGTVAALAAPWNPALWWQLRRLRLAVELDCDGRVLRSGVSPRRYGDLLIRVGERMGGSMVPVAALAEPPSFLERRLKMITERTRSRGATWKTAVGLVTAGLLVGVACEAPAPSVTEPGTEVEAVGQDAPLTAVETPGGQPLVYVDGVRVAQETSDDDGLSLHLPGIEPESIDRIEVIKGAAAEALYGAAAADGVIQIFTKEAGSPADTVFTIREVPGAEGGRIRARATWRYESAPEVESPSIRALQEIKEVRARRDAEAGADRPSERVDPGAALEEITATAAERAKGVVRKLSDVGRSVLLRRSTSEAEDVPPPLLVVDGEIRTDRSIEDLEPEDIASIQVLKGEAGRAAYGSRGANGVILITLKR